MLYVILIFLSYLDEFDHLHKVYNYSHGSILNCLPKLYIEMSKAKAC